MKIIKQHIVFIALFFIAPALSAQVCPAGFSACTLDWSADWNPAWNNTTGPHTMTTSCGVDVTFELTFAGGAGCDASALTFGDPLISAGDLRLATDWPNSNCSMTMELDFSVGSPINVQNVSWIGEDVDFGNNSWQDQITFNGASNVVIGTSISSIIDGGFGIANCAPDNVNCHVTGTWDGPINSVDMSYSAGPNSPANPNGQVVWITDVDFCHPDTVPVTLGAFKSNQLGNRISAQWETVSESFNLGFTLWGEVAGKWVALSDSMVRSRATDTAKTSKYRKKVNVRQYDEAVAALGLSSIDTNGTEEFYGPFDIGKSYGLDSVTEPIIWQPIRDAYERRLASAKYRQVGSRWRKAVDLSEGGIDKLIASLSIPKPGMYRITYEELVAKGLDLAGIADGEIAVSFKGKPVPRDIIFPVGTRSREFGAGASIIFYGASPNGEDALYVDSLVYQISRNRNLATSASRVRDRLKNDVDLQTTQRVQVHIEENKFYDEIAAGEDPWMMAELFSAGSSIEKAYQFSLTNEPVGELVKLQAMLNSVTDFDKKDVDGDGELDDEHRAQIIINNEIVADETIDGTQAWNIEAAFNDSLLRQGVNEVKVRLTGDTGYDFSLVNIDSIAINYASPITAHDVADTPVLTFSGVPIEGGFSVLSNLSGRLLAYAYTDKGNLARVPIKKQRGSNNGLSYLNIKGISESDIVANYWISRPQDFLQADGIWLTQANESLLSTTADYIIITDPSLSGVELDKFVKFREEDGYTVKVFTNDVIVDQFGYGMKTPNAFKRFLKEAHLALGFKHLLLVGGHTYDYLNHLGADVAPINFIPTFYRRSYNLINYSPTDFPFSDVNDSGSPDIAIGRWPVRTVEELKTIIDKTIIYEAEGGLADAKTALLIAERNGGGLEDFAAQLDRVALLIGDKATDSSVIPWGAITKNYVDDVESEGFARGNIVNTEVRNRAKQAIDSGQTITLFSGHGSPTRWSNQNLFTWRNVMELDNTDKPTQIGTLACYTTYYQSPSTESLAHQFLFDSAGAVSVNGASVLGSIRGNEVLLGKAVELMLQEGKTMGEAIRLSKQKMLLDNVNIDTVITWATLGDPALRVRQ